ncbi:AAA family ATPase [Streptomyces neyagawaensis]|uniref:AAA family ATPase n=1 Tax=Streptomyces neyagawaensis TaxID=42238 RepID=A0ABV3B0Q5_9ACTN
MLGVFHSASPAEGTPSCQATVVLDYGLWGRDERSALRWLARSAGAACQVVYVPVPVDKDVQLARIAHRQATTPHQTSPMSETDETIDGSSSRCPTPPNLPGARSPPRRRAGRVGRSRR